MEGDVSWWESIKQTNNNLAYVDWCMGKRGEGKEGEEKEEKNNMKKAEGRNAGVTGRQAMVSYLRIGIKIYLCWRKAGGLHTIIIFCIKNIRTHVLQKLIIKH